MKYRTAYQNKTNQRTNPGTREVKSYRARLNKQGRKVLVEDKTIDLYELIQQDTEEADVHTIIKRAQAGDTKTLEMLMKGEQKGGLIDLTQMPQNLIEAKQKLIDAENTWNQLDKNMKQKFNNNVNEFLAGVENGEVQKYIESLLPKKETKVETTTTETTSKGDIL